MNAEKALEIIDKIFKNVFEQNNNDSLDKIFKKYAFDVKLPQKVFDFNTNEETWSSNINAKYYITNENTESIDRKRGWMIEKKDISSIDQIIEIWKSINMTTTERVYNSNDVVKSDPIYRCSFVYQSTNCSDSKNIIYCDGCHNTTYSLASSRSTNINFCIRVDDSNNCSNSYNVICSNKISNSLFIDDCSNLYECIFCSHISNKNYCIANMQFESEEYFTIKKEIINWIMES